MRVHVRDALGWTPECGALSAEDGLAGVDRFTRTCAALTERLCDPRPHTPIIIASDAGAEVPPRRIASDLGRRWPQTRVSMVMAGQDTLPASLFEAGVGLEQRPDALWIVVDLRPGAELAAAFWLTRSPTAWDLQLERTTEAAPPDAHLNPCAPALSLAAAFGVGSVSIRVGWWRLALLPAT